MEWPEIIAGSIITGYACKGCRKLLDLALAPLVRKKKALDVLQEAQALTDAEDIKSGKKIFKNGELYDVIPIPNMDPHDIPLYAGKIESRENLNANLSIAADILKNTRDEDISDEPVKQEWFSRWRREAEVISSADMQYLWGKILAEEVKQPGNISYRTLDVVKNLTLQEAEKFTEVLKYRMDNIIISSGGPVRNTYDAISLKDAFCLSDAGLLSSPTLVGASLTRKIDSMYYIVDANKTAIGIQANLQKDEKVLCGYALSPAGLELRDIPDSKPLDSDTMKYFFEILQLATNNKIERISAYNRIGCMYLDLSNPVLTYPPQ